MVICAKMKTKSERFIEVVTYLIDIGQALNRGDLAKKADLGPNTISRIDKGHVEVSEDTIRKLANKFGQHFIVEYIRGSSDYMTREQEARAKMDAELLKAKELLNRTEDSHPSISSLPPAFDLSLLIENAVKAATAYADKTIATLEKQVLDKDRTIADLRASLARLERENIALHHQLATVENNEILKRFPLRSDTVNEEYDSPRV